MKRVLRTIGKNFGVKAVRKRYRKVQALKAVEWENTELIVMEKDHMGQVALTVFTPAKVLYYRCTFVAQQDRTTFTDTEKQTKSQGE